MIVDIFSFSLIDLSILIIEIGLSFFVGYFLLLTVASLFASKKTMIPEHPKTHFHVLIPAHNEEVLLPELLQSLYSVDYPSALLDIHVVADNCSDRTAILARKIGVNVHERFNDQERGKGFALQWLLDRISKPEAEVANYIVILDADSIVSENFFRALDAKAQLGEEVMQANYAVRDPQSNWVVALRHLAMVLTNYLRPLGRCHLGCSSGLHGNGMAFEFSVIKRFFWTNALSEDSEYHATLLLAGYRVAFVPDAVVWAEMPGSLHTAQSQNERWEAGKLEVARRWVIPLLREALSKKRATLYVSALDLIIPPFTIVFTITLILFCVVLFLGNPINYWIGFILLLCQLIYVLSGIILSKTPITILNALIYAPILIVWKLLLFFRIFFKGIPDTWIRTQRND